MGKLLIQNKATIKRSKALLLLMLGVTIFSGTLFAQKNEVFPDGDIEWYTVKQNIEVGSFYNTDYGHFDSRETVTINEIEYRSIYRLYDDGSEIYKGAYRVENDNKKVFFIKEGETEESLVYDFGLEVGDEIILPGYTWLETPEFTCTEVGEIELGGVLRKTITLTNPGSMGEYVIDQYWIEGIGDTRCPFIAIIDGMGDSSSGGVFHLSCFFHNDEKIYSSWVTDCTVVGVEELINEKKSTLTISPNPVTGTSKINSGDKDYICDYQITNVLGVVCQEDRNISTSEITVDNRKFTPGIYLLTTKNCENKKEATVKFIIN